MKYNDLNDEEKYVIENKGISELNQLMILI